MNNKWVLCNISDFNIDKDFKMCYNCFYYYEEHNPSVMEDYENGKITKLEKKLKPCLNCDNNITFFTTSYVRNR